MRLRRSPRRLEQQQQEEKRPSPVALRHHQSSLVHSRIARVALVVHVVSLVACAAAASSGQLSPCSKAFPPSAEQVLANETEKCFIWNEEETPKALCSVDTTTRVFHLRSTFLFPQQQPLSLYEVFAAGSGDRDIPSRLRPGAAGADCLRAGRARCEVCFSRLAKSLRELEHAFRSFDDALLRFDCLPAVDTASATRPFSPNGSCTTCRSWYRRWLLVQMAPVWRAPPCINWCFYAQLACPHLGTSKVVDYAGHPSFQCRDLNIPSQRESVHTCDCVHPCDLRGVVATRSARAAAAEFSEQYDFYAADAHCAVRAKQCAARSTAHDRSTTASSSTTSLSLPVLIVTTWLFYTVR